MARLQILELPTIYREHGDDETPFVLVIDQYEPQRYAIGIDDEPVPLFDGVAEKIGARQILVFTETVEIPANNVTLDDGHVVRLKIQPDLAGFREQVEEEVLYAQGKLTRALHQP